MALGYAAAFRAATLAFSIATLLLPLLRKVTPAGSLKAAAH